MLRLALEEWGAALRGSVVWVVGDNQGVRDILAGGTVRRSQRLQHEFVRILAVALKFDLILSPSWCASEDNTLCDAGSHLAATDPADAARYCAVLKGDGSREHVRVRAYSDMLT